MLARYSAIAYTSAVTVIPITSTIRDVRSELFSRRRMRQVYRPAKSSSFAVPFKLSIILIRESNRACLVALPPCRSRRSRNANWNRWSAWVPRHKRRARRCQVIVLASQRVSRNEPACHDRPFWHPGRCTKRGIEGSRKNSTAHAGHSLQKWDRTFWNNSRRPDRPSQRTGRPRTSHKVGVSRPTRTKLVRK